MKVTEICATIQCCAADEVSVIKVELFAEVASGELLCGFSCFHVQTYIIHPHLLISSQLQRIQITINHYEFSSDISHTTHSSGEVVAMW